MAEDDRSDHLIDTLREDLRYNRELMERVHESLVRDREEPPPWVDDLMRRVENIEKDLYGNGREGIKNQVAWMAKMPVFRDGTGEDSNGVFLSTKTVVGIGLAILGAALTALWHIIGWIIEAVRSGAS